MALPRLIASALLFSTALVASVPALATEKRSDGELQRMTAAQAGWVNEQGKPVTGKEGSKRTLRSLGRPTFDGKPVKSFYMVNGKVTKETVSVTTGTPRGLKTSGLTGTISGAKGGKFVSHSETTLKSPVFNNYSQSRTVTGTGSGSYTSLPSKAPLPRAK